MANLPTNRRWAAFAGLAAAGATTLLVTLAAPALADDHNDSDSNDSKTQATTCTEKVNVRSQPSTTAPVIGSCGAGEKVTVDKTEGDFAYLVNKNGWASTDYLGGLDSKKDDDNDGDRDRDHDGDNRDDDDDSNHDDGVGGGLL